MPEFETITLSIVDGIATLTLNRPDKLNAFNNQMLHEMVAAFDATDADDDVRAVIVTGAGRGFCAGADLEAGSDSFNYNKLRRGAATQEQAALRERDGGGILTLRIFSSLKPVIAAINGASVGIGATMTLPMDIRLASTTAKIGFVFARRGLVPEACSSWFLPRAVGINQALEWTFSGRVFPASEALDGGLVRSLHEPDDLLTAATAIAREIADNNSAVSIVATRQLLWRMLGANHPMEAHRIDSRLVQQLGREADVAEGVMSFLEKRPAEFSMKPSTDMPEIYPWWEEPTFTIGD